MGDVEYLAGATIKLTHHIKPIRTENGLRTECIHETLCVKPALSDCGLMRLATIQSSYRKKAAELACLDRMLHPGGICRGPGPVDARIIDVEWEFDEDKGRVRLSGGDITIRVGEERIVLLPNSILDWLLRERVDEPIHPHRITDPRWLSHTLAPSVCSYMQYRDSASWRARVGWRCSHCNVHVHKRRRRDRTTQPDTCFCDKCTVHQDWFTSRLRSDTRSDMSARADCCKYLLMEDATDRRNVALAALFHAVDPQVVNLELLRTLAEKQACKCYFVSEAHADKFGIP